MTVEIFSNLYTTVSYIYIIIYNIIHHIININIITNYMLSIPQDRWKNFTFW